MLYLYLAAVMVVGVLAGAVAALKVIAPATKTDRDDKVLAVLEKMAAYATPEHLAELKALLKL